MMPPRLLPIRVVATLSLLLGIACFGSLPLHGAETPWQAGVAKVRITPQTPLWMAGYGGRNKPCDVALHDLYVRVLALKDQRGHVGIVLSSDTLGIPQSISDEVAKRAKAVYGLERSQLALHASHTHCGPVLRSALYDAYPIEASHIEAIEKYSVWFTDEVVKGIGAALGNLRPASVSTGTGICDFAVNRRTNREPDVPKLRADNNLFGPVDHTVPTLAVRDAGGKLIAVTFAYACHNTTMDFYKWSGDYAGFAQFDLEERFPGALALFCMGCGADQNPLPRRTIELCESYGRRLAASVATALEGPMEPLASSLATSQEFTPLVMQELPKSDLLEEIAAEPVNYRQRWASRMLKLLANKADIPREYPYPVQVWKLGGRQTWITLGGEVVVDYSLRLKGEFGERTWITGYCNDVMAYIPSKRVLMEGGYEGQSSMQVYGLPTERWADDVEDRIMASIRRQMNAVNK